MKFQVWSSDQEKLVDLGNYYLIWKENYKKGKATKRRNHWSWRVKKISMLKDLPHEIKPSVYASTDTHWGYFNYVKQCLSCHSLNGFGGENGPDLLSNRGWVKKSDQWLKKLISDPKSINKKTKMSAFPKKIDIRNVRIKNIVLYLRYLTNPKNSEIETDDKKQKERFTHSELLQKLKKEKFNLE